MFRYVVLGLLCGQEPLHGYALMKAYQDRFGVRISTGNFYRDLQRLVAAGLVRTVERAADDDPRRAPYTATEAGAETFRRWCVTPAEVFQLHGHEDELSARLAFLADVSAEDARRILGYCQDELWSLAKSLERARDAALAKDGSSAGTTFPVLSLMLSRRIRRVAAELAFLDDLRQTHEEWLARQRPAAVARPASVPKVRPGRGATASRAGSR